MNGFSLAFVVLAPITSGMFLIGTTSLYWAMIPAGFLAVGAVFNYTAGNWPASRSAVGWMWPFVAFLLVAIFSLLTSPYRSGALIKGAVQVVGIVTMLLAVLALNRLVDDRKSFLAEMLRLNSVVLGWIGILAIVQFGVNNIVRFELVSFKILQLFGGGTGWRPPGMIGALFRANSVVGEPAHMATFLCMGAGLAFMRLGGLGMGPRNAPLVRKVMPQWAAIGIIGGFVTSLSLVGYLGLAIALAGTSITWFVTRSRQVKTRGRMTRSAKLRILGVALAAMMIPLIAGGSLVEKLATVGSIYDNPGLAEDAGLSGTSEFVSQGGNRLSALALAVNAGVMIENLKMRPLIGVGIGAHPIAYDRNVPDYVTLIPALVNMNKDDAGALFTRLLSETGFLGPILFSGAGLWVPWRGLCAARLCSNFAGIGAESVAPVLAAVTGSWLAVFILYLARLGLYYSGVFWLSLSFVILMTEMAVNSVLMAPVMPRLPRSFWVKTLFSAPLRAGFLMPTGAAERNGK